MSDVITIQEYNLLDYSLKLQEAVESGYRVGDGVDGCPMIVGFSYCATLSKAPVEVGGLGQAHEAAIDSEPIVISGEGSAVQEVCSVYVDNGVPVAEVNPKYLASDADESIKETYDKIKEVVNTLVESPKPPTKRTKRS